MSRRGQVVELTAWSLLMSARVAGGGGARNAIHRKRSSVLRY